MNLFKGSRRKGAITVVAVAAAVVVSTGAAWAYITLSDSGNASAAKADVNQVQVSSITIQPAMLPGAPLSAVKFSIVNPNNFPVTLKSVTRTSAVNFGGSAAQGCQESWLVGGLKDLNGAMQITAGTSDLVPNNAVIPAAPTTGAPTPVEVTVPGALGLDGPTATAACSASFTVKVDVLQGN